MKEEWPLALQAHCAAQGVMFHHKQNGGLRPGNCGRELGGRMRSQKLDAETITEKCNSCQWPKAELLR